MIVLATDKYSIFSRRGVWNIQMYHRNFTAGYDTRGRTDSVSANSYINRPEYPLAAINGYADAPFSQRYYDRRSIDHPEDPPSAPTYQTWDNYAAADPAYFYAMYGTRGDPMYTSRDGIQAPYWGMEYAEVPKTRMRYLANWIGKRFWRNGRRGGPGVHLGTANNAESWNREVTIYESQLPKPYVLVLGDAGSAGIKENRLVKIPMGAIVVYISNPKWCQHCGQWEEVIEDVMVRSGSTYGSTP